MSLHSSHCMRTLVLYLQQKVILQELAGVSAAIELSGSSGALYGLTNELFFVAFRHQTISGLFLALLLSEDLGLKLGANFPAGLVFLTRTVSPGGLPTEWSRLSVYILPASV